MTPAETPNSDTSSLGDGAPFVGGESGADDRFAGLRAHAYDLRDQALGHARDYATSGKEQLSATLDGYAETVREAAQEIEDRAGPDIARYAHQAADFLDEASATLKNKDVDELIDEARELMRRSPALAIGAAAALGFALSRFLKATSEALEPSATPAKRPSYDA